MRNRRETETRLKDLICCATTVFCNKGYRQTQMADVAKAMGVAPGTLYLYVEGKDALFDLVVRHGVETGKRDLPESIPIPNRSAAETLDYVRKVLKKEAKWPKLKAALQELRAQDPRSELSGVIEELYSLIIRNRWGLILLSRAATEFPGLAEVFFHELREPLLSDLAKYIRNRVDARQFISMGDPSVVAAFLNETIAWAAMNRMCDPVFRAIPDDQLAPVVLKALVNAFTFTSERKRRKK